MLRVFELTKEVNELVNTSLCHVVLFCKKLCNGRDDGTDSIKYDFCKKKNKRNEWKINI